MDEKANKLAVKIFGQNYTLLGVADHDYMLSLAHFVDGKMREISQANPGFDSLKVAILTAVNISNELIQLRDEKRTWETSFREKSENLINLLDKTLGS
jgi:cell division protein ZapA